MIKWEQGQELLGEYLIEKEIGQSGGMGRVWLVKSNSTGRRFAVKQTKLKDDKSRKAFLAELQTWIDLPEHPNIVPCRFFRTVGDEIVIFTDYIEGGSLKDWIDQGKLTTLEQILDVAIQFAWGLHAIHERGLVHQDVKPGNVLMTADGVPMVADFGLVRARQVAPDGQFVSPNMPLGHQSVLVSVGGMSPAYASPEQHAGTSLSRKTDIWSWGVSVLDMFMGGVSCPHGGYIAADVFESFYGNGGQEAGLPKMPDGVADILSKCLVYDPDQRWYGMGDVAEALMGAYESACHQSYPRDGKPKLQTLTTPYQHDRYGVDGGRWRNPREWLKKAYEILGQNINDADLYQASSVHSRVGAAISELRIIEEAERIHKNALSVWNPIIAEDLAHLLDDKSCVCESMGDMSGALAANNQGIEILKCLVGIYGRSQLSNSLAGTLMNKASTTQKMGDFAGADKLLDECIMIWHRLVELEGRKEYSNHLAMAYFNKGNILLVRRDLSAAIEIYDRGIEIEKGVVEKAGHEEYADNLAAALLNKGSALRLLGNLTGAIDACDQSVIILRRMVKAVGRVDLQRKLAGALMNYAHVLCVVNDLSGSVKLFNESIDILDGLVNKEGRREYSDAMAQAMSGKGDAMQSGGFLKEALYLYEQSIGIWETLVEQEGRSELIDHLSAGLLNKANVLHSLRRSEDARAAYDQCISHLSRLVDDEGKIYQQGDLAKAILLRASLLASIGNIPELEQRRAHDAFHVLLKLVDETKNAELAKLAEWAQGVIRNMA